MERQEPFAPRKIRRLTLPVRVALRFALVLRNLQRVCRSARVARSRGAVSLNRRTAPTSVWAQTPLEGRTLLT